jgi:hypothetical protein
LFLPVTNGIYHHRYGQPGDTAKEPLPNAATGSAFPHGVDHSQGNLMATRNRFGGFTARDRFFLSIG